jgi:MFS family permease
VRRLPSRIFDAIAPTRLGRSFRWLLAAETVSNFGDGVAIAAGPLLVASQTDDPFLVSMALLAEYLPTLLFGVVAGAVADRFDRRLVVAAVNVVRAVVLALLTVTIATGNVEIAVVLVALFALGTAETFVDTAGSSLVPRLVERQDLGTANARMEGAYILTNQLIGPPIGAFLFVAGTALPFATNAACFALGALLVTRVAASATGCARRQGRGLASWRRCGKVCSGSPDMRRCGPSPSRSSPSTSPTAPHSRCSCSMHPSSLGWTPWGSGC